MFYFSRIPSESILQQVLRSFLSVVMANDENLNNQQPIEPHSRIQKSEEDGKSEDMSQEQEREQRVKGDDDGEDINEESINLTVTPEAQKTSNKTPTRLVFKKYVIAGAVVSILLVIVVTSCLVYALKQKNEGNQSSDYVKPLSDEEVEQQLGDKYLQFTQLLKDKEWELEANNWDAVPLALQRMTPRSVTITEDDYTETTVPPATLEAVIRIGVKLKYLMLQFYRTLHKPDAESAQRDGKALQSVINNNW